MIHFLGYLLVAARTELSPDFLLKNCFRHLWLSLRCHCQKCCLLLGRTETQTYGKMLWPFLVAKSIWLPPFAVSVRQRQGEREREREKGRGGFVSPLRIGPDSHQARIICAFVIRRKCFDFPFWPWLLRLLHAFCSFPLCLPLSQLSGAHTHTHTNTLIHTHIVHISNLK